MINKYIVAGWAATSLVAGGIIWFLWGQYDDERRLRAEAETAVAVQATTLETVATQVTIAKEETAALAEENAKASLLLQEREKELNDLRLVITQQAYEAPYRNSVDLHNWLARWMRDVEATSGGRTAGTNPDPADEASSDPVSFGDRD